MVRPEGSTRWIRDRAFPVRDDDGNHMTNLTVTFQVTFPEGTDGDAARRRVLADVLQCLLDDPENRCPSGLAQSLVDPLDRHLDRQVGIAQPARAVERLVGTALHHPPRLWNHDDPLEPEPPLGHFSKAFFLPVMRNFVSRRRKAGGVNRGG